MDTDLLVSLIILLPLAGAVLCGLVPLFAARLRKQKGLIGIVGTAVIAASFLATTCARPSHAPHALHQLHKLRTF